MPNPFYAAQAASDACAGMGSRGGDAINAHFPRAPHAQGVQGWPPTLHIYHRVNMVSRTGTMAEQDVRATDPASHQPTKADMEEDVSIDATPEALACAVTRGGAERREDDGP